MARNNQNNRGSGNRGRNNNPEGRNQYSNGMMDMARERPMAAAAAAAGAVAAGVFLWSKRNQISDQLSNLSEQIGDWTDNMGSSSKDRELESIGGTAGFAGTGATGDFGSSGTSSRDSNSATGSRRKGASSGGGGGGMSAGKNERVQA